MMVQTNNIQYQMIETNYNNYIGKLGQVIGNKIGQCTQLVAYHFPLLYWVQSFYVGITISYSTRLNYL